MNCPLSKTEDPTISGDSFLNGYEYHIWKGHRKYFIWLACSEQVSIAVRLAVATAATSSDLVWPAMTERIRISLRTRRKPSGESEARVQKHTGTCKSWLHSSTQGWHYVACVRAQCGFQATKGSSQARPRMEWKLAFDRALGPGFRACEAE